MFAAFAAMTALTSMREPLRVWGLFATMAYVLGAITCLFPRARAVQALGRAAMVGGATVVPLAALVTTGRSLSEVRVIEAAAGRLLSTGTPYLSPAALAGRGFDAYDPYLPGMSVFGLPSALTGGSPWADPRWLFVAVFVVLLAASLGLPGLSGLSGRFGRCGRFGLAGRFGQPGRLGGAGPVGGVAGRIGAAARTRYLVLAVLTASPVVAIPLTGGGDDLPVIALCALGLAAAARDRPGRSGLVVGLAATLKATAWPAVAVCLALVAVRGGSRGAGRFAAVLAVPVIIGIGLPALVDPAGFVENAVRFPLGLTPVTSPADSPLPGALLAGTGPAGHAVAIILLVLAVLGVAVSLVVRPPAGGAAAARRLAVGMLLAMMLMPATRYGYAIYPVVFLTWAHLVRPRPAVAEPSTVEPSTVEPSTVEPATVEPATVEPATVEPATVEPSTVEPATVEPARAPAAAPGTVRPGPARSRLRVSAPPGTASNGPAATGRPGRPGSMSGEA